MSYTYKDFVSGKIKKTRGEFVGFTQPTGILKARFAIFRNPRGSVWVPEYLLTKETREQIKNIPEVHNAN